MSDERTREDAPSASWGFPAFAKDFPRHPALDELVAAFERGDYAAVRRGAPKLTDAEGVDEDIKQAARLLRARIEPDPLSRKLFVIALGVLVLLSAWWVGHDGPEGADHRPAATAPSKP
jgi:hypothetical protein